MAIIGADCKLYRNTGTWATPVWDEIELVKDLTLTLEKGDADVSNRGSGGWRLRLGTLKDGRIEFGMVWEPGDDDFTELLDAYNDNTLIDLAAMDGDIETEGSQGFRAEMSILNFSREEPLDGPVMATVNAAPGSVENAPQWLVVPEAEPDP